jgi:hypothetical protein
MTEARQPVENEEAYGRMVNGVGNCLRALQTAQKIPRSRLDPSGREERELLIRKVRRELISQLDEVVAYGRWITRKRSVATRRAERRIERMREETFTEYWRIPVDRLGEPAGGRRDV